MTISVQKLTKKMVANVPPSLIQDSIFFQKKFARTPKTRNPGKPDQMYDFVLN